MSRILVLSLVLASLSTVVGCGARGGSTKVSGAEGRDESRWMPQDEVAMSFDASQAATDQQAKEAAKTVSIRPNRQDRPTRGAVHAATY